MQQQNERSVPAEVPVDEGEGQLHEHGRYEREEEREPLPDLVPGGAVRGAEVERCRGLGREQRHRHKDGTGESHPHSLRHLGNAARGFAQGPFGHNVTAGHVCQSPAGRDAVVTSGGTPPQQQQQQLNCDWREAGCFHSKVSSRGETAGGARGAALISAHRSLKQTKM